MQEWILGIELNGEWEHCTFSTRQEALTSFAALSGDYAVQIARAVIFRQPPAEEVVLARTPRTYIN